ncbi:hypothetical protein SCAR479_11657 [Seiridium cardinale]|uniref:Uncharacterized protein n=1 Tax=Seiridium cardinale TaxID=138064 RepID=A0ABR2XD62_9PEZI
MISNIIFTTPMYLPDSTLSNTTTPTTMYHPGHRVVRSQPRPVHERRTKVRLHVLHDGRYFDPVVSVPLVRVFVDRSRGGVTARSTLLQHGEEFRNPHSIGRRLRNGNPVVDRVRNFLLEPVHLRAYGSGVCSDYYPGHDGVCDRGTDDEKDSMYSEWNFNSTRPAPTTSKANISQTEQEKNKLTKSTEMIQTFASELSGIVRPLSTAETMLAMFR